MYVATVRADGAETTPRRIGIVPHTTWWWVDGEDYLGRISVRHRLTEFLRDVGGHVGYYVRPSRRRLGHATAMLRAVPAARRGPRPRAGAGHLRRHQRGLAPRDRGRRRRARGPTGGQAPLLAADALTPPHRWGGGRAPALGSGRAALLRRRGPRSSPSSRSSRRRSAVRAGGSWSRCCCSCSRSASTTWCSGSTRSCATTRVLGHMRFLLEAIRPELQQYFIERNYDGRPVRPRHPHRRSTSGPRASTDEQAFGTERDVNELGYEYLVHSTAPRRPAGRAAAGADRRPGLHAALRHGAAQRLGDELRRAVAPTRSARSTRARRRAASPTTPARAA